MQHSDHISRRTALQVGAALGGAAVLSGCGALELMPTVASSSQTTALEQAEQPEQAEATPTATALTEVPTFLQEPYRAIWVSYLEWQTADFSSAEAFTAYLTTMFENCVALGMTTVLLQVRPFGDAFYPSEYYPWSHFITGTQGQAPSFDPFALMIEQAHAHGLRVEAWINPYRLRLNATMPEYLSADNLYYTHPDWVVAVGEGLYLNPALQETADYVCQGVQEIITNYAVDGIHFDDYFYPTTEDYIDDAQFVASGAADRSAWRLATVSALVQQVYQCIKEYDDTLSFGISPQGNPDNNESQQFSDVSHWMNPAEGEAFLDYVCPQVYWGYHYTMQSGSDRFAFENIIEEWLAMPRAQSVALTFGLGAYRIGDGDGGQNDDSVTQWNSGENLASMIADLTVAGADGYALYRYNSLYQSAYPEIASQEIAQITALNQME